MEECPTPICLVQTHCIVMTQHFLILLFTLDKIKTGEVCKESVNDQRSCRGRSIRQAGAPTRMHVNLDARVNILGTVYIQRNGNLYEETAMEAILIMASTEAFNW